LAGLQDIASELEAHRASVVAISVDHAEASKLLAEELGLRFPLLADPKAAVIERYGVRMAHEELAVPAVFVVRTDGTIAWRHVSEHTPDRPTNDTVLDVLEKLGTNERTAAPGR
jgi:peroxiredoxin